jgi:hypothetical protein
MCSLFPVRQDEGNEELVGRGVRVRDVSHARHLPRRARDSPNCSPLQYTFTTLPAALQKLFVHKHEDGSPLGCITLLSARN